MSLEKEKEVARKKSVITLGTPFGECQSLVFRKDYNGLITNIINCYYGYRSVYRRLKLKECSCHPNITKICPPLPEPNYNHPYLPSYIIKCLLNVHNMIIKTMLPRVSLEINVRRYCLTC